MLARRYVPVRVAASPRSHGSVTVLVAGRRAGLRHFSVGRRGAALVRVPLGVAARKSLRGAVATCSRTPLRARVAVGRTRGTRSGWLSGGTGCGRPSARTLRRLGSLGGGPPASFQVGAATADFTPPAYGTLKSDRSDCDPSGRAVYDGPHPFAFMEPYVDAQKTGHYDPGDPYLDCNANGRWDGNFIGGGSNTPRYYTKVADPVTARAMVVSNGSRTLAVEVVDQEGLFNVYADRIRKKVADDGFDLNGGVFISATHDESAPDTLGINGQSATTSSVNAYFADYLVARSAQAIEQAYRAMRPAYVRYAEAMEPANLRQCWSSYPYVDNQRMPAFQAVGTARACR